MAVDDKPRQDYRVTPEMVYEVAYGWCRKLGLPLMSPPRAPEAIDQLGREVERLRSAPSELDSEGAGVNFSAENLGRADSAPVDDTMRLRDVEPYLSHLHDCTKFRSIKSDNTPRRSCSCGLDRLLSVDAGKPENDR